MGNSAKSLTIKILSDESGFTVNGVEAKLKGVEGEAEEVGGSLDGLMDKLGRFHLALQGLGDVAKIVGTVAGAAFQLGNEFDSAYDTIQSGTGATGLALDGLKDTFRGVVADVPANFEDASSAVGDLNQRLGLTGPPLQVLASQFLNLARITGDDLAGSIQTITRVFGDWSITDQAKAMDEMFRASQATGVGMQNLADKVVQFGAPLRGLGFSFEQSIALISKWEKEGVNFENVMGAMKKAYGEFSRDFGAGAPEAFRRFMDELKRAPNASAAAAKAIEMLGVENGPDFAAAVTEGRFAYDDLVNTIVNGSSTINGTADDTADFAEKWQLFINRLKLAAEPIAMAVFDAVGRVMDTLGPLIQQGADKLAPTFQTVANAINENVVPVMRSLVDDVLPRLQGAWDLAFGGLENVVNWITSHEDVLNGFKLLLGVALPIAIYAIASALVPLIAELWAMAAAVIAATWPFLLIAAAIVGLGAGISWLYRNWTPFHEAVDALGRALVWLWNSVLVPVGAFIVGTLIPIVVQIAGILANFVGNLIGWVGNIPGIFGGIVEFFENLPGAVLGFLSSLWATVSSWIITVATSLPGLLLGWVAGFLSWIASAAAALPGQLAYLAGFVLGWIVGTGINIAVGIASWVASFMTWIVSVAAQLPGWLAAVAGTLWNWLVYVATVLPGQLVAWAMQFLSWAMNLAGSLPGWLMSVAGSIAGWIAGAAGSIIGWLGAWIGAFANWAANLAGQIPGFMSRVGSAVAGYITSIPGVIAGALGGLASVGRSIVEGIWSGISAAGGWLWGQIRSFASGIVSGFLSAIRGGSPAMELTPVGESVTEGIGLGITRGAKSLQRTIKSTMRGLDYPMGAAAPGLVGGYQSTTAPGAAGLQVIVHGYVGNEEKLGRELTRQLLAAERQGTRMPWAS